MKKVALCGLVLLIALFMSCKVNDETAAGIGSVTLKVSTGALSARTAMPNGLDIVPDYFVIEGDGPGDIALKEYFVVPNGVEARQDSAYYEVTYDNIPCGDWLFNVYAMEWPNDTPMYNGNGDPKGGFMIGEVLGPVPACVRAGLICCEDVIVSPCLEDGTLKITADWSDTDEEYRERLKNLELVLVLAGDGLPPIEFADAAFASSGLNDGLFRKSFDLAPGYYTIMLALLSGDAVVTLRTSAAIVISDSCTEVNLPLYLNAGSHTVGFYEELFEEIDLDLIAAYENGIVPSGAKNIPIDGLTVIPEEPENCITVPAGLDFALYADCELFECAEPGFYVEDDSPYLFGWVKPLMYAYDLSDIMDEICPTCPNTWEDNFPFVGGGVCPVNTTALCYEPGYTPGTWVFTFMGYTVEEYHEYIPETDSYELAQRIVMCSEDFIVTIVEDGVIAD